mmetsp:Transcript_112233/g.289943  ORF Transcript_112233/g.289943 Transcript_112233/m.289943 type:complete len:131 (+) Transcript_112233:354-746(+)
MPSDKSRTSLRKYSRRPSRSTRSSPLPCGCKLPGALEDLLLSLTEGLEVKEKEKCRRCGDKMLTLGRGGDCVVGGGAGTAAPDSLELGGTTTIRVSTLAAPDGSIPTAPQASASLDKACAASKDPALCRT